MKEKLLKLEEAVTSFPQMVKLYCRKIIQEIYITIDKLKDLSSTNYQLGLFHIDKGNINDAKMRFMFVIKLKPDFALAHYHLARCHMFNSAFDKAKNELSIALSLDPKHIEAKYRLNLLNRSLSDEAIPIQIIKEDYNSLASGYENYMLEQLKYDAPEILAAAIAKHVSHLDKDIYALDIGCGTGLVGAYLSQTVTIKSLIGVDISEKMLELSRTLAINNTIIYSEVKELDFCNLKLIKGKFNVIAASMSFGYINDLQNIFVELNDIILEGAILGIVVLKSATSKVSFNYENACFAFSEEYLKDIFQKFNWHIEQQEEIPLFVDGTKGLMFVLKNSK